MILTIDDTRQRINIQYETLLEKQQFDISFERYIRNARHKCRGNWKGNVKFLESGGRSASIGLWKKILKTCQKFNFECKFYGLRDKIFLDDITESEVRWFCIELLKDIPKITIRDRQILAVYNLVKFRYCLGDLATSTGKTLILFLYIMYLRYKKLIEHALIICHDADSVMQMNQEFIMYANARFKLQVAMVHGGSSLKDITDAKIIIGNFQTLSNRDANFFAKLTSLTIISDECQKATNDSIKYIIDTCPTASFRIGVSGSIKEDDSADIFDLYKKFGPVVCSVKKKELMDSGEATPIDIKVFMLNWATIEQRKYLAGLKAGKQHTDIEMFRMEQEMIRGSSLRDEWISEFVGKTKDNMLVLFIDVKEGYGKKLADLFRTKYPNKSIYYIDGDVDAEIRDTYKKRMETNNDTILVATYATYGTGKSIKNLKWILCAESMKGFNIISQAQGRGMRLNEEKEVYHWIDIVDDISINDGKLNVNRNYMMKHFDERLKQYKSDGFDFDLVRIVL